MLARGRDAKRRWSHRLQHPAVTNPFLLKLDNYTRLSREESDLLLKATAQRVRRLRPGEDLIREGERPREINVFLSGWAYRYKQLTNGRRQIIALLLPGDVCDHDVFTLQEMDHSIAALTPATVAEVSRGALDALTEGHPRIVQALTWETLVNAAVQREWTVNLGQRSAVERVAHLLCELFVRLRSVGLTEGESYPFPLTQIDLAEATGISAVHVNRTLQDLRSRGLVLLRSRQVTIPDFDALASLALFTPTYLHLRGEGRHLDAEE